MTKYFISDLGDKPLDLRNVETGEILHIPRYGVWELKNPKEKGEVIETSDNLEDLQSKYPKATFVTI